MTTKILIVNLGPGAVNVIAHDPNSYSKYAEQTLEPSQFAAELYLHSGQRVTVVEVLADRKSPMENVYGAARATIHDNKVTP